VTAVHVANASRKRIPFISVLHFNVSRAKSMDIREYFIDGVMKVLL
jgi:hypothetical protein